MLTIALFGVVFIAGGVAGIALGLYVGLAVWAAGDGLSQQVAAQTNQVA